MQALNKARAAWERTQPQMFLDLEPLEEAPDNTNPTMGVGGLAGVSSSGPASPLSGAARQPTTAARPQPLGERCAAGPRKEHNP
jgi:hypothetical protein